MFDNRAECVGKIETICETVIQKMPGFYMYQKFKVTSRELTASSSLENSYKCTFYYDVMDERNTNDIILP